MNLSSRKEAGSFMLRTRERQGSAAQSYEYDSFGSITHMKDPAFVQPYAFTGREYDSESGLYFYRARYYDPKIGRFISEDPIGFAGGDVNLFSYTWNSPQNWTDPLGLTSAPGFWESLIPVWGSGKQAVHEFECGRWGWGTFHAAVAISDVFLVKAAADALAKGALKISGVHTWEATRKWLTKKGWREFKGQHMHHWLIPQNGWGRYIPDAIKNQPWNLMGMRSAAFHRGLHGIGPDPMNLLGKTAYGTPTWFKLGIFSSGGRVVQNW